MKNTKQTWFKSEPLFLGLICTFLQSWAYLYFIFLRDLQNIKKMDGVLWFLLSACINIVTQLCNTSRDVIRWTRRDPEERSVGVWEDCLHFLQPVKMNPPMINSTSSVSTTKSKIYFIYRRVWCVVVVQQRVRTRYNSHVAR